MTMSHELLHTQKYKEVVELQNKRTDRFHIRHGDVVAEHETVPEVKRRGQAGGSGSCDEAVERVSGLFKLGEQD